MLLKGIFSLFQLTTQDFSVERKKEKENYFKFITRKNGFPTLRLFFSILKQKINNQESVTNSILCLKHRKYLLCTWGRKLPTAVIPHSIS